MHAEATLDSAKTEAALARKCRVAQGRAQWRADRDAGRLPPPKLRPAPWPHPIDDFLARGVPPGCVGQFVWPRPSPSDDVAPGERGLAVAAALEAASAASPWVAELTAVPRTSQAAELAIAAAAA